jgi:hypothetical protein
VRAGLAAVLAALLALGLVACGGDGDDDPERESIEVVTERFSTAIANGDAAAFCAILAPNDVQKLGEGESDGKKECLVVWGKDRNPLFSAEDPELEVESVSYEGDYATAELTNGGELGFAKEGGRWYVHLAPEGSG